MNRTRPAAAAFLALAIALQWPTAPSAAKPTNPAETVPFDSWYDDAVWAMAQLGVLTGLEDGTYGGDRPMTRAEFVTAWGRVVDELRIADLAAAPPEVVYDIGPCHWARAGLVRLLTTGILRPQRFEDVDLLHRAAEAVAAVAPAEPGRCCAILDGDRPLTRGQYAQVVYATFRTPAAGGRLPTIREPVGLPQDFVVASGILIGRPDGGYAFDRPMQRIEFAAATARFLELMGH